MRRSLLVFAEGEVTEEDYLGFYRKRHRGTVTVELSSFHGTPLPLVEAAVAAKQTNEKLERKGKGAAHDEVWCMFDTDQHPHLHEAIALAAANGIHTAISCPCVELWFLLHFDDQTAYIERHPVQSASRTHLGCDKALTTPALETLAENFDGAKERARKLDVKHAGDATPTPANPSSGVWRLIDSIGRP